MQQHLISTSTTAVYAWFTDWMPAAGFERWKAVLKQVTPDSTFNSTFAYQTAATRTDKPDAPATVGSGQTGTGELCSEVVTPDFSAVGFVRFGLGYKLTSGSCVFSHFRSNAV